MDTKRELRVVGEALNGPSREAAEALLGELAARGLDVNLIEKDFAAELLPVEPERLVELRPVSLPEFDQRLLAFGVREDASLRIWNTIARYSSYRWNSSYNVTDRLLMKRSDEALFEVTDYTVERLFGKWDIEAMGMKCARESAEEWAHQYLDMTELVGAATEEGLRTFLGIGKKTEDVLIQLANTYIKELEEKVK